MTKAIYLDDTYHFENAAKITQVMALEDGSLVYCDATIFYPQGGGQPSDQGVLEIDGVEYPVYFVSHTELGIAHHISAQNVSGLEGKACLQKVNPEQRLRNAKSHTAGHLISHILETIDSNLVPAKGHHFPGEAYIEVIEQERTDKAYSVEELNTLIEQAIQQEKASRIRRVAFSEIEQTRPLLAPMIPKSEQVRVLEIEGYAFVPCGGTHVSNMKELSGLTVTRAKRKKDRIKFSYEIV